MTHYIKAKAYAWVQGREYGFWGCALGLCPTDKAIRSMAAAWQARLRLPPGLKEGNYIIIAALLILCAAYPFLIPDLMAPRLEPWPKDRALPSGRAMLRIAMPQAAALLFPPLDFLKCFS